MVRLNWNRTWSFYSLWFVLFLKVVQPASSQKKKMETHLGRQTHWVAVHSSVLDLATFTVFTVSVPIHQRHTDRPCSSCEINLEIPFAKYKADWVSRHADVLCLTASEFVWTYMLNVFSVHCLTMTPQVSCVNKWLFCRHCFCISKKVQAQSVAPWQHIKYLIAPVRHKDIQPV